MQKDNAISTLDIEQSVNISDSSSSFSKKKKITNSAYQTSAFYNPPETFISKNDLSNEIINKFPMPAQHINSKILY